MTGILPDNDYALIAEDLLERLYWLFSELNTLDVDNSDDYSISHENTDLLRLTQKYLEVSSCNIGSSKECVVSLLFALMAVQRLAKYDEKKKMSLIDKKAEFRSRKARYDKAKKCLDDAAGLLGLPEGYFYKHVQEKHPSFGLFDNDGNLQEVFCTNYIEAEETDHYKWICSVPRFLGESHEFYNRRLPPDERDISPRDRPELDLLEYYGESGGGKIDQAHERRLQAASSILIGTFVPKDIPQPYQLIANLLKLCGIERSGKDVRSTIDDRDRRSEVMILGSARCLSELRRVARNTSN
ncbi:hypothetical protein G3480_06210 [Thiorhodococcus mannitoliphagus]|uniref:Uncharacterized protein n=1 Tax=Thiorhodococcus mannitoliphagus TaxID=329406 RepID=A0A6P1DV35_9GAMM|nr:hypothetical protein [Thiorhodococcus mannitoliphagus]NEX19912.1 hypothetical protein [Thiorhodococcus mannitoliphagus]